MGAAWGLAIAGLASLSVPAQAVGLADWQYSPETGAIVFNVENAGKPSYFLMANPMRIVVDLPGSYGDAQGLETLAGGVFSQIRVANSGQGTTRLVLQLAPGTVLQPGQVALTAQGGDRWSLQPLLAGGIAPGEMLGGGSSGGEFSGGAAAASEPAFAAPTFTSQAAPGAGPAVVLPPLEATQASPQWASEGLSADDMSIAPVATELAPLDTSGAIAGTIPWAAEPMAGLSNLALPMADIPVQGGERQLPPVPVLEPAMAAPASAGIAPAPLAPGPLANGQTAAFLPQLPQPRLGEAPLALNSLGNRSLVDPAQIVDIGPLRLGGSAFSVRPPAAVKPVIDPRQLSLDGQHQSAVTLGGKPGLVMDQASLFNTQEPGIELPVVSEYGVSGDGAIPFLVEFGAPLPGVSP